MGLFVMGLTVASAMSASAAATIPTGVLVTVDRFTGVRVTELKPIFVYRDAGFMAINMDAYVSMYFSTPAETSAGPDSITFAIIRGALVRRGVSTSDAEWKWSKDGDHFLRTIVDGERSTLGSMRYLRGNEAKDFLRKAHHSQAEKWLAPEVLALTLPSEVVLRMIEGESTEGSVDGLQFFLQNKRQGSLDKYRAFARYLHEAFPAR